jgi:hypothetical protein
VHGNRHSQGSSVRTPYAGSDLLWIPDRFPHSRLEYFGAPQTVALMRDAALDDQNHFETRQLVESICENLDSKDYVSEYLACYHFILQHTRYMRDPRRQELVRAPYVVSREILAGNRPSLDCDDLNLWLASAVLALGGTGDICTAAFKNIYYQNPETGERQRQYSHVFLIAKEPRTLAPIVLDPVAADKTREMLSRVKAARLWPLAA